MPSFPEDGLLFVAPVYSSKGPYEEIENGEPVIKDKHPKLYIKTPVTIDGQTQYIDNKEYEIIVETLEEATPYRQATYNDIIANRMCIFRFKRGYNKAILTNSPLFNDAAYSHIQATDAEFLTRPIITTHLDEENNRTTSPVATMEEISELTNKINKIEDKIIFGTEPPEEALSEAPIGTIYIQVEED